MEATQAYLGWRNYILRTILSDNAAKEGDGLALSKSEAALSAVAANESKALLSHLPNPPSRLN